MALPERSSLARDVAASSPVRAAMPASRHVSPLKVAISLTVSAAPAGLFKAPSMHCRKAVSGTSTAALIVADTLAATPQPALLTPRTSNTWSPAASPGTVCWPASPPPGTISQALKASAPPGRWRSS